jgi:AraC-like DNA-binding protein
MKSGGCAAASPRPVPPQFFGCTLQKIGTRNCARRLTLLLNHTMNTRTVTHEGIARSLRFLSRHWRRPIKVADLTAVSGLSRRGFLKAFIRHTGCHPGRELRRRRMEHAQRLVLRNNLSLHSISRQCGYRSVNSFWVAFRQFTGRSVAEYRHSMRATPGPARIRSTPRLVLPRTAHFFQPSLHKIGNEFPAVTARVVLQNNHATREPSRHVRPAAGCRPVTGARALALKIR